MMAGSVSAEVWLDQRRWDALEEALKVQSSDIDSICSNYLNNASTTKLFHLNSGYSIEASHQQRKNWRRRRADGRPRKSSRGPFKLRYGN